MPPISYHRFCRRRTWHTCHLQCLAHRHASNLTRSTEVREREPYIGFVPFVSARYLRSLILLYPGQRSQSSPGQVETGEFWDDVWLPETGAEGGPELVWKYVEPWRCQEIGVHLHHAVGIPLPYGRKVEKREWCYLASWCRLMT